MLQLSETAEILCNKTSKREIAEKCGFKDKKIGYRIDSRLPEASNKIIAMINFGQLKQ